MPNYRACRTIARRFKRLRYFAISMLAASVKAPVAAELGMVRALAQPRGSASGRPHSGVKHGAVCFAVSLSRRFCELAVFDARLYIQYAASISL
jgi:hypothetical protein